MLGADSWWQPNAVQIAAAKAAGFGAWSGYFSDGHDGIYGGGWSDATFRLVMAGGLKTQAFCSYRADAATWKARAAALGIPITLDCERSVDGGDGPAVDPWLATSGARLYGGGPRGDGTIPRHLTHGHNGYIVADYESSVAGYGSAAWPTHDATPTHPAPLAWQYAGGVAHSWGTVDLGYYEDGFFTGSAVTPEQAQMLVDLWTIFFAPYGGGGTAKWSNVEVMRRMLAQLGAAYAQPSTLPFVPLPSPTAAGGAALTPAQSAALAQIPAIATALASGDLTLAHIEAALKAA